MHNKGSSVDELMALKIIEKIQPWAWLSFYRKKLLLFFFLLIDFPVLNLFNFNLFMFVLWDTQIWKKIYLPVLFVSFWISYLWRNKTYLLRSFDDSGFYENLSTLKTNLIWRCCTDWSKFDVFLKYKVSKYFV